MYYFWSLEVVGDLFLIIDDNLVAGVSKHLELENDVTLCENTSDITSLSPDGYYCVKNNDILNVYRKVTNVGYFWSNHDLVHIGIAGSVKSKNNLSIDKNQWLFVGELNTILSRETSVSHLKPSSISPSK